MRDIAVLVEKSLKISNILVDKYSLNNIDTCVHLDDLLLDKEPINNSKISLYKVTCNIVDGFAVENNIKQKIVTILNTISKKMYRMSREENLINLISILENFTDDKALKLNLTKSEHTYLTIITIIIKCVNESEIVLEEFINSKDTLNQFIVEKINENLDHLIKNKHLKEDILLAIQKFTGKSFFQWENDILVYIEHEIAKEFVKINISEIDKKLLNTNRSNNCLIL